MFDFDYSSSLRDRFSLNDTNIFKYSKVKKLHDSQKRTNYSQIFRTLIHYHFLFRQIYSVQKRAQSNIPVTFNDNSAKLRQSKGNKRHLSSRWTFLTKPHLPSLNFWVQLSPLQLFERERFTRSPGKKSTRPSNYSRFSRN